MNGTTLKALVFLLAIALSLLLYENLLLNSQVHELLRRNVDQGSNINGLYPVASDAFASPLENEQEATLLTRSGAKCINFEETLDDIVASSNQVYVTMPAKGAGSSMVTFTQRCHLSTGVFVEPNVPTRNRFEPELLLPDVELPNLIAGHCSTDAYLMKLIKNLPRTSLIIYLHRDETDRLVSAIKMVVMSRLCPQTPSFMIEENGHKLCLMSERYLIDEVIKVRKLEIGHGEPDILTCDLYDAIEENRPQIIFGHYKQADKLQRVLAKYHCPDLLDAEEIHANVAANKNIEVFLKLEKDGKEVPLNDWLEKKRDMLEYTFALRKGQTCRGKSRNMQDDLLTCEDELLQVTRDTFF